MAEKLTDKDLKSILNVFYSLSELSKKANGSLHGLTKEERDLRDKVLRIVTKQPDPIPYCNCMNPDFNHKFVTPFCNNCYGVPRSYK